MRLVLPAVATLVLWTTAVAAQEPRPAHQQTTPPSTARYEIVQSPVAARWTFRLDRYSGHVSRLTTRTGDDLVWENMEILDPPAIANPVRPRLQIFTSGFAARYTFLLDTETGRTWQVVTDTRTSSDGAEYEAILWKPLPR